MTTLMTTPMSEKKILIVDDHPLIQHGLYHAVSSVEGLRVCGTAGTLAQAEKLIESLHPDGMILDMHLPDGDGLGLLRKLQLRSLRIPTLILSICDEMIYAPRMFAAGARGFVMKDQPLEKILEGLRKVLDGNLAFSDKVVTRLLDNPRGDRKTPLDALSTQELAACRLLAIGLRNKEVAVRMDLSPQTIGTYKSRILRKLGLRSQFELEEFMRFNSPEDIQSSSGGERI